MSVAIVTGAAGLVGAESVRHLAAKGLEVVGIDNNLRQYFFGPEASTSWSRQQLEGEVEGYVHHAHDIRDRDTIDRLFRRYGKAISVVVHTAAQPSHDWAAREPTTDFEVNAIGTLNLLESVRQHAPQAAFIFTSTNKVYGDTPNRLPLVEQETRWEVDPEHRYAEHGIDESMSIDNSLHSLFGASKLAADILVQEYGRYFDLATTCFRAGCLTGPGHSGAQLHGFLAYLVKCAVTETPYKIFGYHGKQVRDNIHVADLVEAFWQVVKRPRSSGGEVYNIGGGRFANCSVLEAIAICEQLTGRPFQHTLDPTHRVGDHIWWISDNRKFAAQYPGWQPRYDIRWTLEDIYQGVEGRAAPGRAAPGRVAPGRVAPALAKASGS